MRWFILAMVVVSASAFFAPQQPSPNTPTTNNAVTGNRLPDMNMVMQLVRQILALLIPKLMANPNLMAALAGGNNNGGATQPPAQPQPQPHPQPQPQPQPQPMPPPMQPQPMHPHTHQHHPHHPMPGGPPQPPPYMGGGGGMPPPQNAFFPQQPPPMGMGAGMGGGMGVGMGGGRGMGMGIGAMGDKFKEMRIMELVQDPRLNLHADPMVAMYIPRGPLPFGWSMPDKGKEALMYSLHRKQMRGALSQEGRELMHLVGDMPLHG